ncbi:hypothetical protein SDC9_162016 [bioreactor metagenome]|uniref:Uncharacterized protein n=1 Tax=bioreactor metagenome TaxID=1076179 RepID=A0A645FMX3_9ZZZZ
MVGVAHPLLQSQHKPVEYLRCRQDIRHSAPGNSDIIQVCAVQLEVLQVRLKEMQFLGIEQIQIAVQELAGGGIIEWLPQVMQLFQHPGGYKGDPPVSRPGAHRAKYPVGLASTLLVCRSAALYRRNIGRSGQCEGQAKSRRHGLVTESKFHLKVRQKIP